jgi:hypothetical protein
VTGKRPGITDFWAGRWDCTPQTMNEIGVRAARVTHPSEMPEGHRGLIRQKVAPR